ncbi:MAG: tetratricopeptide repeat protein, partial [Chloroflexi bacterium]|nr:tetratricopeptide repeat protein [Chloroflexota bacterium]
MAPDLKDFKLSQAEFERFRDFILDRIGLDFQEDKRHLLTRGLAEVLTLTGNSNLDQLYLLLHSRAATTELWDQVISILTVGETYFFRNANHWDALRNHILPELMAQRGHSSRRIRIWSAGCATGEEPYSVAMLLRETIPNLDSWNILILATDLNREALRKAQAGLYGSWSFRGVDRRIQDTYFEFDGKSYALDEHIKRMVTFNYLNLVGDNYPSLTNNTNAMDIILCRNVTIYFTPQVTVDVVRRFHETLTDGGWLIPGPSEPNMVFYGDFETRNLPGTVVYQKTRSAELRPAKSINVFAPTLPQVPAFTTHPTAQLARAPGASVPVSTVRTPIAPPRPPVDPFEAAQQLIQAGQLDEALVKLYEKLDRDAAFVPAYYTLGKIYANKGNLGEAQAWCEKAIQKDKLHAAPYYTLSLVYQEHGLFEQAVEALKRAVYLDRDFVLAHYTLAQLYQRQGDAANAQRSLHNALRLLESRPRTE